MKIGIVGAGQLGQMLALAGIPLGLEFLFLDRSAATPAGRIAPVLTGEFTDPALLAATRARRTRIAPPLSALATCQDRWAEKRLFARLGIATTRCAPVDTRAGLGRAVARIGLPGMLKTRRLGYDGKGQHLLRAPADLDRAWQRLGGVPLLFEEFIPFDYEVSVIGARGRDGAVVLYPLNWNYHVDGILRLTRSPWQAPALARAAGTALRRVLRSFNYVGVLAIEFFVRRGRLIANEMAPRVHNSGHWTIEGSVTSQFENHVRALAGLPLGPTDARGHAAMINLIGSLPDTRSLLAEPGLHLHAYGKQPRAGRKLGHCTLIEATAARRDARTAQLLRRLAPQLPLRP
jgi:5-(carboxyamino)imidazole ribonucleotide synthase